MTINNPYWEAVQDCVEADGIRGNPVVGYFRLDRTVGENIARSPNRMGLVRKYCWSIPDPDTVTFVAKHAEVAWSIQSRAPVIGPTCSRSWASMSSATT